MALTQNRTALAPNDELQATRKQMLKCLRPVVLVIHGCRQSEVTESASRTYAGKILSQLLEAACSI
jgi:hypothetical protein